jgi:hypothetical protein
VESTNIPALTNQNQFFGFPQAIHHISKRHSPLGTSGKKTLCSAVSVKKKPNSYFKLNYHSFKIFVCDIVTKKNIINFI